jgi:hypothetical protein
MVARVARKCGEHTQRPDFGCGTTEIELLVLMSNRSQCFGFVIGVE